ncbi:MAG: glutaredoxin domain-containing protein [Cycloclasticus sp.]
MTAKALAEVEQEIAGSNKQVVMFALEWCEFCWAAIKVLDEYEIPYRTINLDSADYVENNRGREMRLALNAKTTWTTLPQIYINSEFIGGCVDIFDECKDGTLQERLKASGISFNESVKTDPLSFLPAWLHPR